MKQSWEKECLGIAFVSNKSDYLCTGGGLETNSSKTLLWRKPSNKLISVNESRSMSSYTRDLIKDP